MLKQRIGIGYDVHQIAENRNLILGGVKIDFIIENKKYGLLAHSDGDVLTHAIIDSILGACGMGDIGDHFPDTSEKYKNIDSLILLKHVLDLIKEKYEIENLDTIVIAQSPKISPYKQEIKRNLSKILQIEESKINIKATTEEGLGFTGTKLGIAAKAICLVSHK
ncbi:MAG: 2-C-methyl-D-erythritol 2,4-cyclodiphosphate synthase [Defluviitaleaceae bacterium]|nr:2-C-methyl-D-erythritol 2,4-cyclodiphosphate synthase [Defluviitaleaceae bacterium]